MKGNLLLLSLKSLFLVLMLLLFSGCEINIHTGSESTEENTEEQAGEDDSNGATGENNINGGTEEDPTEETEENDIGDGTEEDGNGDENNGDGTSNNNGGSNNQGSDDQDTDYNVLAYFPLATGYSHNVGGNVPDGFGEYIEVIGSQGNYYLTLGGSTAMGYYQLYEVNSDKAVLLFEATEEMAEYYELESYYSNGDIDGAFTYALDNTNRDFVLLQGPLEDGNSWRDGEIVNTYVNALQTDDSIIFALLVDYPDREELRYYAEGVGLVGIVYYSQSLQDMFGEAVYAKNIVD
ncbi:MAG: hypothetical protein LRY73_04495 [Bacillus sp. (in: Bacteria)]|nr:hypothetical protein [Bacillus sp. (in: firmicutes)]